MDASDLSGMPYSDIFHQANQQLRFSWLRPVDAAYYDALDKTEWHDEATLSFTEWQDAVRRLGYDPARIKWNSRSTGLRLYFYQGEYATVELHFISPSWLDNSMSLNALKADDLARELFVEKKNYAIYFFAEFNLFALDYFEKYVEQIPESERYEAFKDMYVMCEYGFDHIDPALLDAMFALSDNTDAIAELIADGYGEMLTIYRGAGKVSTPLETAFSWTTSLDVARRFAHTFARGTVYMAHVPRARIIDYIQDRNESEIWVRYSDLENITVLESDSD